MLPRRQCKLIIDPPPRVSIQLRTLKKNISSDQISHYQSTGKSSPPFSEYHSILYIVYEQSYSPPTHHYFSGNLGNTCVGMNE